MQDPTPHQTDIDSVIHQDASGAASSHVAISENGGANGASNANGAANGASNANGAANGGKGRANGNGKAVVHAAEDLAAKTVRPAHAPGLTVERRFTKAGEDVYSTIEWELRDAIISNERGEKVFEQTGVEIPKSWTQLATNVVVSKYFRGHIGTPERERSVRQLISRVADTMANWGRAMQYFATETDAQTFQDELTHILLHQKAAFNSPVWFNVGLPDQPVPQVSACFINSVDDTMESILTLAKTEGMLFKFGSGTGTNFSSIRGSSEKLNGGGTASGPVSFMRGLDQFAGAVKSGGKTRRAAKMAIIDINHPDVEEFILCKAKEEKKAWALIDAGYSGAFNVPGGAYDSVLFQNANNSVRVSDDFMRAYERDEDFSTKFVTTGKPATTYKARDLMQKIGESAWICGDPGMQYDTTINKWHTCKNTDKIYGSNPCCVTGDTLVAVADGRNAVSIRDLVGSEVPVFAHNHATGRTTVSRMWNISVKRENAPIYRVTLDDGSSFRATDDHLIMQRDGSYRMVRELKAGDSLMPFHSKVLAPAQNRTRRRHYWAGRSWLPQYRAVWEALHGTAPNGFHIHHADFNALNDLPENLLLLPAEEHNALHGDKMRGDNNPARRLMSSAWRDHIAAAVSGEKNPNYGQTHSEETRQKMRDKSAQRWASAEERARSGAAIKAALEKAKAEGRPVGRTKNERRERSCPVCRAAFETPRVEQIFCGNECRYSPMGRQMSGEKTAAQNRGRALSADHKAKLSASNRAASDPEMKRRAAQTGHRNTILKAARLLMDNGVTPSVESWNEVKAQAEAFGASRFPSAATVARHFENDAALREEAALYNHKVVSVEFCGAEDVFDGTVDTHHNFAILTSEDGSCVPGETNYSGIFIHNSEYMFLNDSACNLASLNLMKFRHADGEFDVEAFKHASRILITAQEIIVDNASYPTPRIGENSRDYRPLGLGYANLGALLMARGLAYDSDEGRAYAGAITALMTGEAYHQSAIIARDHGWPFPGYAKNREPFLEVMQMHRDAVETINPEFVPDDMIAAARKAWDDALSTGIQHGYRNAQSTVLAPTGCLVAGSMVVTDRGLLRLNRLGDVNGATWQDVSFRVLTDEGERQATKFFINGAELTRKIETACGYAIQGTLQHRVKVVNGETGAWEWKRFSDIKPGDIAPLAMGRLAGKPQTVNLPPLGEEYWTGDYTTTAPRTLTLELAELIGYFMGDGSLHAKGPRFCVAEADTDVAERVKTLVKSLFNLEAHLAPQQGYCEVSVHSVPLALWWEACGFAKFAPHAGHKGKGYRPLVPDALLATNDPLVYGAFLRGLYEADGTVTNGVPCWTTAHREFAEEVKTLLLALGLPTTTKTGVSGWGQSALYCVSLRNTFYNVPFMNAVSFMGERKTGLSIAIKANRRRGTITST